MADRAPTAFLLHSDSALHDTGWGHPEHQGRLRSLASTVGRDMLALHGRAEQLDAPSATAREALLVHSELHLSTVRAAVAEAERKKGVVALDGDTRVSAASWDAALGALGAAVEGARRVSSGSHRNAFVATRPPGHHATPIRPMGFCLFNNVACTARWLQASGSAGRVLIVDWDVHHGNGTQDTFWDDPTVFFLSLHQAPHYPGSGRGDERGAGRGEGFTRNVELSAGTSREAYLREYESALDDVAGLFDPDFVLVSAGFDCLAGDPLGDLLLEPADLYSMTGKLMARADAWCEGKLVACLEGGYDPERMGQAAAAVIRALADVDLEI